ncbi:transcription termination/antitermination NusG family protein [Candidatus Cloacimonadota bacterium]
MATNKPVEVDDLFGQLSLAEEGKTWWVVYTKPRCEKKLAFHSYRKEIEYYLPQIESIRVYKYRKVAFTKPLFPGYIFVKCSPEQKRELIITGFTVNFLKVDNEIELLEQLKQIYKGSILGVDFQLVDFIESGTKVEIISGPFVGLTGVVRDFKNVNEIVMQIDILRKSVAVKATTEQIKKLQG